MSENAPDIELATAAKAAVTAIGETLRDHADDDMIETNVRSLRNLAGIIDRFQSKEIPATTTLAKTCDSDCFGCSVNGIRTWIPMELYNTVYQKSQSANRELEQLHGGLAQIASGNMPGPELAMLCDWEGMARRFQAIARDLLQHASTPVVAQHRNAA